MFFKAISVLLSVCMLGTSALPMTGGFSQENAPEIVVEETGFAPAQVLMVGDRMFDLEGAAEFGMDAVGVLYGFGSREELEKCKNIAIIENISELINILE